MRIRHGARRAQWAKQAESRKSSANSFSAD
jgi:hypothetical protein